MEENNFRRAFRKPVRKRVHVLKFRQYNCAKERILIAGKAARPADVERFSAAPQGKSSVLARRVTSLFPPSWVNQAEARHRTETHPVMRTNDARQSPRMGSRAARVSNCLQSRQPAGKKCRQFPRATWKLAGLRRRALLTVLYPQEPYLATT